ncbi:hypothetical protein K458DRAFT_416290 [Lentithecium fluviatile CBS 122367]|uniref:Uncharacterized protein n=1 Tax=Lentithecium fluviatile CBS 122367 TaxID=1168545 RepID=A0A6G1J8W9_9PLEO|nr:hypothetical protein K458DRAFT_416290 [Lentithecium fluviatile CBS 122367]
MVLANFNDSSPPPVSWKLSSNRTPRPGKIEERKTPPVSVVDALEQPSRFYAKLMRTKLLPPARSRRAGTTE